MNQKPPSPKFDVAVVIVTYNSADEIETCLSSIYQQDSDISVEIVIVDNESQDETVKIIEEKFPKVNLVLPGANLGFAKGVNLGVRNSDAKYVLLFNPDAEILEDAIGKVYHFAEENPKYGLYGGRSFDEDGEVDPASCWGEPTLWSMTLFALGLTTMVPRNNFFDPESLGDWKRDTVREVGVITGCFLLALREVWDELEGLDERFFMYGEDVDLAMRARKAGYSPVIYPEAKLIHEGGKSSDTPVHKTLLLYRGKASLVHAHWNGVAKKYALGMLAFGAGLRGFLSKVVGKGENTRRWQTVWEKRSEWVGGYEGFSSKEGDSSSK